MEIIVPGNIVTFYSYKGGVGRTMALANIAVLLAQWGNRVLIIDWDLEAPGLENFFRRFIGDNAAIQQAGVVDLLGKTANTRLPWRDLVVDVVLPEAQGTLQLLTAGTRGDAYFRRVRDLDVRSFYAEYGGGEYIEQLRNEWKKAYDFVLIDSRTGVTDLGGICTVQLPDQMVMLFTATEQGFVGTLDIFHRAAASRQKLPHERMRVPVIPVPSRFDTQTEFALSQEWLDRFAKDLAEVYAEWLPQPLDRRAVLELTKLPYVSYFSFGEKLPVLEQGTTDPASLGYAYENLATLIARRLEGVEQLVEDRDAYVREARQRQPTSGIVSRKEFLRSSERLPGEVFAIELLQNPIEIERDKSGQVTVTIDRSNVQEVLISNDGKAAAVRQYITADNVNNLRKVDREIHEFLAGTQPGRMTLNFRDDLGIRLRWASGGVLSIVRFAGDKDRKRWVPLFFRDIRPYGWNTSLGSTERWFVGNHLDMSHLLENDMKDPWNYIAREFIEESLIVDGPPSQGSTLGLRKFEFKLADVSIPVAHANDFDDEHIQHRSKEDKLHIREDIANKIEVSIVKTKCAVKVRSAQGAGHLPERKDVLVCLSLLDLGIEVVRVVEYEIEPNDYMLDGEILVNNSGVNELVRMPIALISYDYLKRTFGGDDDWQSYTRGFQPSIEVPQAPSPEKGEIMLFTWDVKRRMAVVNGEWGDDWHRKRFVDWFDKFGKHFVDGNGNPSCENSSPLFVPATAKILNLYFRAYRNQRGVK
ncbi:MAG: AAA family ATPase [Planctomycetota bacterium]